MNTKRFYALCSKSDFPWILVFVFAICQLQFGVSSVSASTRSWVRGVDTNTPLPLLAVCPPSIGFGETILCSIVSAAETDTYTFTASAGDKALVRMSKSLGDLWPRIRVYGPGGTKLCDERCSCAFQSWLSAHAATYSPSSRWRLD
jgi:hypothetical protein